MLHKHIVRTHPAEAMPSWRCQGLLSRFAACKRQACKQGLPTMHATMFGNLWVNTHTQHIKVTGTAGPSAVPGISCPKSSLCNFGMSSDFGQLHSARRCLCLLPGMRQRASAKWKDLDLCHSLFGRQLHHDLNNQYRWLHWGCYKLRSCKLIK